MTLVRTLVKRALLCFWISLGISGILMIISCKSSKTFFLKEQEEVQDEISSEEQDFLINNTKFLNLPEKFSLFIFGVDKQGDPDHPRSDVNILIHFDRDKRKIFSISILRDLWVELPNGRCDRLNSAYALGLNDWAMRTINQLLDLHVSKFITLDFDAFVKIVDSIGGIRVELSTNDANFINKNIDKLQPKIKPGTSDLTGIQALQFVRCRDFASADFQRTTRQLFLLELIIKKISGTSILNLGKLLLKIYKYVTTNLTPVELFMLAQGCQSLSEFEHLNYKFPEIEEVGNKTINGRQVLVLKNRDETVRKMHKFLEID